MIGTVKHGVHLIFVIHSNVGRFIILMPQESQVPSHPKSFPNRYEIGTQESNREMDSDQSDSSDEFGTFGPRSQITISKEIEFDAGHRIPNHKSKCRNPHGHRYRIVVCCTGEIINEPDAPDEGMLVDYGDLKQLMMELIHDPLDHGFIVWENDHHLLDCFAWYNEATGVREGPIGGPTWKIIEFPYIPTAENIAVWVWQELEGPITNRFRENLYLSCVEVWETPTSTASYEGN